MVERTGLPTIDIRRAHTRARTQLDWLDGRHSFSFGSHHDPSNVGHGLLIVSNDDRVAPNSGFGTHHHDNMEIVTWVLDGELEHKDSEGNHGRLFPGLAQRMSAGTGIRHSESNPSPSVPLRLVQMWVVPEERDLAPGYEQLDVNTALDGGGLVAVASGRGHEGAVAINQPGAVMWIARLSAGDEVKLPSAPYVHLFTARGELSIDEHSLSEGDAARFFEADPVVVTATSDAEVIVWESNDDATR